MFNVQESVRVVKYNLNIKYIEVLSAFEDAVDLALLSEFNNTTNKALSLLFGIESGSEFTQDFISELSTMGLLNPIPDSYFAQGYI